MTSTSDRDAAGPHRIDYRRWEVPAVDAAGAAPVGERERRAYAEAYARGEAAGYEAGRAAAEGPARQVGSAAVVILPTYSRGEVPCSGREEGETRELHPA